MDREQIVKEVEEFIYPLLDKEGIEVVEFSYRRGGGKMVLTFLVDTPGGITLGECVRLNNQIGKLLDESGILLENYLLQVSSPGLDRPIKTVKDFLRASGKMVRVVYTKDGKDRITCKGEVKSANNENVTLACEEKEETIPVDKIVKAVLEIGEV